MSTPISALSTLAEKLNWLMQHVVDPTTQKLFSLESLEARILQLYPDLRGATRSNLANIRTGKNTNPSIRLIEAIARTFGIDPVWLVSNDVHSPAYQQTVQYLLLQERGVLNFALRAAELTPESLAALKTMLEIAERADSRVSGSSGEASLPPPTAHDR